MLPGERIRIALLVAGLAILEDFNTYVNVSNFAIHSIRVDLFVLRVVLLMYPAFKYKINVVLFSH